MKTMISSFKAGFMLLLLGAFMAGCSGGGSSSSDSGSPTTATGYFIDSAVQGLSYVSGGQSGTTDADGKFTYEVGKTVRFFIGNIVLGEVTAKGYMTPVDLVTNADASNATVLNIARFLMTLDSDNDPTNGITISDATRTAAQSASTIDFSTATDTTFTTVLVQLNISITLVTVTDAQTHLTGSIYGLYAGTYSVILTANGSNFGTFTMTVDSSGAISGIYSGDSVRTVSGQVSTSGIMTFTFSGKTEDSYSGTIDASTGAFSATCTGACVDGVSVTGTKQTTTSGTYTGTYSGTLTVNGSSLGTFSMTVDSAGAMNGSINVNNEITTLSGQVNTSGIVTFTLSGKTDTYSGTIDASTGAFSATCTSGCVDNVTFTGTKQTTASGTVVGTKFSIASTSTGEFSVSAAFDGTNYLVATEKVYDATTDTQTAQLISQSGSTVGSLISSGRTGGAPLVAFDGTNYLMVWPDDDDASTTNDDIYGQFVSPSGTLIGSPFYISNQAGYEERPAIKFDGTNYFVAWDSAPAPDGCADEYGQFVKPDGTLLGSAIKINSAPCGGGAITTGFDGTNLMAVWLSEWNPSGVQTACGGDGCEVATVYGQLIAKSSAGTPGALTGSNFSISTSSLPVSIPAVAFDGTNYLVIFPESTTLLGSCPASGCINDIYAQFVTTAGALSGGRIAVSNASGSQDFPSIAYAFQGDYLVTWTDMRNDANKNWICDTGEGSCLDVYGQYVSPLGGVLDGSEFVINNDAGNQFGGVAGFNGGKYFMILNAGSGEVCHNASTGQVSSDCDVYGVFVTPSE